MLSISNPRTASGAASYYLHMEKDSLGKLGEYYAKEGEAGYWTGNGANALGLTGQVKAEDFKALAAGYAPDGTALARNAGEDQRRAGLDLTWSAPKSVSVVWSVAEPEVRQAIEQAHARAVQEGLALVQGEAGLARTGAQGQQLERAELVFAVFQHGTSREQDAQLHSHAFLMNLGIRENGQAASLASEYLFDWKMAAGAAYQAQLAHELRQLGYEVTPDGKGSFHL